MNKMLIANISTYINVDDEAEHYYCSVGNMREGVTKFVPMPIFIKETDLYRKITSNAEVTKLNKKDRYCGIKLGDSTNRFNTFKEIHDTLMETYPGHDIISYFEYKPFKEMLFIQSGKILTYKDLGEVFYNLPHNCWKDLLPDDLSEVKVKCLFCGSEHSLEDLIDDEIDYEIEKRTMFKFTLYKNNMLEPCCGYPQLAWNIIL